MKKALKKSPRRYLNFNCLLGDFFNAFFIAFVTVFCEGKSAAEVLPFRLQDNSSSDSEMAFEFESLEESRPPSFSDGGSFCCFACSCSACFCLFSSLAFTSKPQSSDFIFSPLGPLSLSEFTVKLRNCFSFLGTFSNDVSCSMYGFKDGGDVFAAEQMV